MRWHELCGPKSRFANCCATAAQSRPGDELTRKAAAFAREIMLAADAINMLDQVRKEHQFKPRA
jgi:hypothetical protein